VKGAATYYVLRFANVDVYFLTHVVLQALVTGFFAPPVMTVLQRLVSMLTPGRFKDSET